MFVLNTRGHGINYALDVVENSINMGPVLPYDKTSEQTCKVIELRNPMSFPIEVFSTDFDTQHREEEEILKKYELLNTEKGEVIFESLRKAGMPFWPTIRESWEAHQNYEALQDRVKVIEERLANDFDLPEPAEGEEQQPLSEEKQQEKEELEKEKESASAKIAEIESESKVEKVIRPKVKTRDRLSVILFGPEK